jgi:hypothetical protein
MPEDIQYDTAARCARGLIAALQSGSQQRVGSALVRIENLGSDKVMTADARELEFRDLLAGIVQSVPMGDTALRMLEHVAMTAG